MAEPTSDRDAVTPRQRRDSELIRSTYQLFRSHAGQLVPKHRDSDLCYSTTNPRATTVTRPHHILYNNPTILNQISSEGPNTTSVRITQYESHQMATFRKSSFNTVRYAAARPTYPRQLYDFIFRYHEEQRGAKWELAVDLGCGTGSWIATSLLLPSFSSYSHSSGANLLTFPQSSVMLRSSNDGTDTFQARHRRRPLR